MKNQHKILLSCIVSSTLLACAPTHNVRGNIIQDYQLDEIQVGLDTQSDVLRKLGSPTTKAPFDENTWFYIGQETEKHGILDPKVTSERIIHVSFNSAGILETFQDLDTQRLDLPYVRRETPTSGNSVTALQQFLGNLGRFNRQDF